ncbi:isochorismate synthase [Balneolaceae bacterium YR4-1]|uniref:isochorismate synthase n=1 Tax=Halalkalibaculum roseum TaxID=2709311 RepID=A0A6M1SP04_9BACT|nr:isochorismate synthase [Halalkalibaculum roseum]NGP76809.1 isochorismate synthase [Halalkalibaculum roseum]
MSEKYTGQDNIEDHHVLSRLETSDYSLFLKNVNESIGSDSIVSVTMPIEKIDPLACLELLNNKQGYHYFWEKPSDEFAIAAGKALKTFDSRGEKRFRDIENQISKIKEQALEFTTVEHSHAGIHFLGGFSFFEESTDPAWKSFGSASFVIPEWQIIRDGHLTLLTLNFKLSEFYSITELDEKIKESFCEIEEVLKLNSEPEFSTSETLYRTPGNIVSRKATSSWIKSVNKAKRLIAENQFEKIVLAREATIRLSETPEPTHIINILREQYPNCYSFLIRNAGNKTFLGCTPERLISFKKNYLLTEALAGSIQRGNTASEDAYMSKELMKSPKNAHEHNYVIRAIEQKLKPFVKKIEKGTKPVIKKLTNVQHLFTPITAWLKEDISPLDIVETLHPTPAVGGFPWDQAKPYIKELENFDRGWYAGPVGWLNSQNGGEFAVAIRSGLVEKETATFFAGCGIVEDSDAETEWQETILKLRPMLSALKYD